PPAHAMGEILAVDSEFISVAVDAAHDDVNVRVVRVVVVYGRPDETPAGVLFDLAHELAGQFRQVELSAILRRDHESKLPFLIRDAFAKLLGAEFLIGPVQPPGRPVALHPVAFEIGEMSSSELSP